MILTVTGRGGTQSQCLPPEDFRVMPELANDDHQVTSDYVTPPGRREPGPGPAAGRRAAGSGSAVGVRGRLPPSESRLSRDSAGGSRLSPGPGPGQLSGVIMGLPSPTAAAGHHHGDRDGLVLACAAAGRMLLLLVGKDYYGSRRGRTLSQGRSAPR